jgi:hypothetical protein
MAKSVNRRGFAKMPTGRIRHVEISRLICGGNLIIGSAHDRDLIYVASLMRHYFTDRKIIETWQTCEECGINTMIGPVNSPYAVGEDPTLRVYNRYRKEWGGRFRRPLTTVRLVPLFTAA